MLGSMLMYYVPRCDSRLTRVFLLYRIDQEESENLLNHICQSCSTSALALSLNISYFMNYSLMNQTWGKVPSIGWSVCSFDR